MIESMFHLHLPILEKLLRPMVVYLFLIGFLRLFGKRELAQLNPFDLVVLLSLSNTVQNAMIGDDNSVTGGIIGAFGLLAINWMLTLVLFRAPKLDRIVEGTDTILIRHGKPDEAAMKKESLTEHDLMSVLHKQGMNSFAEVEKCVLESNGTFYLEAVTPNAGEIHRKEVLELVRSLSAEVKELKVLLAARG
ncbi:MAG TPA: YetF domain-containing protein [Edaphobacter sp.]|nr:YetF domain-containing protein [Edaphobacter sp.]